ncbi:MAG: class I SAM-dependent methyltransferase [Sedimenticolaceae bacterium]
MQRIPEPEELMNDSAQAKAYADADFSEANQLFVELLERLTQAGSLKGRLLDLGCGPGDIPLMLVRRHPQLTIDAVDGAPAMLDLARQKLAAHPDEEPRIRLMCKHLPCPGLKAQGYDLVASNSLLHHLADPDVLWQTVASCARPSADILVMDLARPDSTNAVDALVERYADDAPPVLRRDFRNSLFASYTPTEVEDQLQRAGLNWLAVTQVSDRHLAIAGKMPS